MNRVALALSALLFAACEVSIASSSIDAGALDAAGLECDENPCLNGGTCNLLPDGFRCLCPAGYEGELCETDVDDCASNPCKNEGVCSDRVASYSCACAPGFSGVDCSTNVDECADEPCENGGTCTDMVNSYGCDCIAGYTGSRCEVNVDDCSSLPCDNDGECQDEVNGFSCICKPGNTGSTCSNQVETCSEGTCQNAGTCQDGEDGFTCTCAAGFNGTNCQDDIDDCAVLPCQSGANCVDQINGYTCQCPDGYEGVNCENLVDPCNPDPCQNDGSCTSAGDYYVCSCPAGYNGPTCEHNVDDCLVDPCRNGGACTDLVNDFACACTTGYTGHTCSNEPPTCPPSDPCVHGECKDAVDGYTCDCDPGFTGGTCNTNVNDCLNNPCGAHGTCTDGDNRYSCLCDTGYEGPECQTDVDECEEEPCQNDGTCSDRVAGFDCDCRPGWAGETCEANIDECVGNQCLNDGTCVDGVNGYTCDCPRFFAGDRCQTDECTLVGTCGNGSCDGAGGCTCETGWQGDTCGENKDECTIGNPCLHGGSCADSPGSFSCTCTAAYTGTVCDECHSGYQDNDDDHICCPTGNAGADCTACDDGYESVNGLCQVTCTTAPKDCGDHGTCDHSSGAPACACEVGYVGPLCDSLNGTCSAGTPCGQNGDCSSTSDTTYKCACDAGYIGRNCELIDECVMAVVNNVTLCQNNGTCIDGDNTFTCECASGWIGADCTEPDNCVVGVSPGGVPPGGACSGNGTCLDGDNAYTCTCSVGWLGTICAEPDNCLNNNCQRGVCHDGTGAYTCDCANTGYTGEFCQLKIDYCGFNPCQNGSVCSDIVTSYQCDCTGTGFTGPTCEIDVDECADAQADVCADGVCGNTTNGFGYNCNCPDGTMDVNGDGTDCAPAVSLVAGELNTCALTAVGSLHCWGDNSFGQLGQGHSLNPTATEVRTPRRVGTGTGWQKVSVGNGHVCGVRNGHLFCWGNNDHRQLGGPGGATVSVPFELRPDLTWTDVSVGAEHSCALADTALYCWGNTTNLQAGTAPSGSNVDAPKLITGTWKSVSAGAFHTCAINTANELRCWGLNTLGVAQTIAAPLGTWTSVKAGPTHTCAVAGTNTYCWGAGVKGALGNGVFANSATPVQVSAGQMLASLATGDNFSCGALNDADAASSFQIYCWGTNQSKLLLTADTEVNVPQVVTKPGSPVWTAYAVGTHHMCAIDNGTVYCWGGNANGELGSGVPGATPVSTATAVKNGAVLHSRSDDCFPNPCQNGGDCTNVGTGYTCDCAGTGYGGATCATETNECMTPGICGQGTCNDLVNANGYTCTCPDGLIDVDNTGTTCASAETIANGANHTCLITTAKTLHCWGSNRYGQFGLGNAGTSDYYPNETSQTYRTPLRVKDVGAATNVSGWTRLIVGENHTCATLPTGVGATEGLYCWGDNAFGQVGIPPGPPNAPLPRLLDDTQTWIALSGNYSHTCGITAAGALYCWGINTSRQIGVAAATSPIPFSLSTPVPLPVADPSATRYVAVAAGLAHTCAITDTGTTSCWGLNVLARLGIGTTTGTQPLPQRVNLADPQGFTSVRADFSHSCALAGTSAYCWGQNGTGGIGTGGNSTSVSSPTAVTGGRVFSSLTLGSNFSCGLVAVMGSSPQAYSAYCWGNNVKGMLQVTPTVASVNIPTAVTTRQWRVFDLGPTHICGVDNSDGKLYCWGDNGLESLVGQGKLGTVPSSLTGNFDLSVVKTAPAKHTTP